MSDLISRKALLEKLKGLEAHARKMASKQKPETDLYYTYGTMLLERVAFGKVVENQPPAQQWIPVEERLPEDENMVLVTCVTKKGVASVNRAYWSGDSWHGSGSMSGVVAWMDMPEPYRKE